MRRVRLGSKVPPGGRPEGPPKPEPKAAVARRELILDSEQVKPVRYRIPTDPINEATIIAAAIAIWRDEEARTLIFTRVRADDFSESSYAGIWRALEELHRRRLGYDPRTLVELGGGTFSAEVLADIVENNPQPPPSLDYHVERLRWHAARIRASLGPIPALLEALASPASAPERVQVLANEVAETLRGAGASIVRNSREVAAQTIAELRARHSGVAIYPFGLDGFDTYEDGTPRIVPGAAPGQMTLIAGLPGSGKSVIAKLLAILQAARGRRVLYGAWEMGFARDLESMACVQLGIDVGLARIGRLESDTLKRLEQEIERLSSFITFMDRPGARERRRYTNEEAIDRLGEAIVAAGADVVVCDLWKRMLRDTKPQEEELALTDQQQLLQDTKCHGIFLHQLNSKDVERRDDPRPTRDALKGSGGYLEFPDNIFGVHRPGKFGKVDDTTLEMICMKQRDRLDSWAVAFDWDGSRRTLTNGREVPYNPPGTDSELDEDVQRFLSGKKTGKRDRPRFGGRK